MKNNVVARLICRILKHDYSKWQRDATPAGVVMSRYCKRYCGLPGAQDARREAIPGMREVRELVGFDQRTGEAIISSRWVDGDEG